MEKTQIINELQGKIQSQILKDDSIQLAENDPLITSGLIDSFSLVDLALIVEELFQVRIEDFELNSDTFDTLEQLAELIVSRLAS